MLEVVYCTICSLQQQVHILHSHERDDVTVILRKGGGEWVGWREGLKKMEREKDLIIH